MNSYYLRITVVVLYHIKTIERSGVQYSIKKQTKNIIFFIIFIFSYLLQGQFKCIGTSSYIKSKYGKGYSFTIKCKRLQNLYDKTSSNNENRDAILMVENYILESIPHTVLKDKRQETLFFQCSRELSDTTMADIFYQLENNRHTLSIESFSVSETTLEQVFMTLAKNQEKKNKEKKFVSLPRELFHERN